MTESGDQRRRVGRCVRGLGGPNFVRIPAWTTTTPRCGSRFLRRRNLASLTRPDSTVMAEGPSPSRGSAPPSGLPTGAIVVAILLAFAGAFQAPGVSSASGPLAFSSASCPVFLPPTFELGSDRPLPPPCPTANPQARTSCPRSRPSPRARWRTRVLPWLTPPASAARCTSLSASRDSTRGPRAGAKFDPAAFPGTEVIGSNFPPSAFAVAASKAVNVGTFAAMGLTHFGDRLCLARRARDARVCRQPAEQQDGKHDGRVVRGEHGVSEPAQHGRVRGVLRRRGHLLQAQTKRLPTIPEIMGGLESAMRRDPEGAEGAAARARTPRGRRRGRRGRGRRGRRAVREGALTTLTTLTTASNARARSGKTPRGDGRRERGGRFFFFFSRREESAN